MNGHVVVTPLHAACIHLAAILQNWRRTRCFANTRTHLSPPADDAALTKPNEFASPALQQCG